MDYQEPLLLFDGVCNLCSGTVKFIAERDDGEFTFAPLQSDIAERVLEGSDIDPDKLETLVLIENGRFYTSSGAVIKILEDLGGKCNILAKILSLIPEIFRDLGYEMIRRTRYHIFGSKDECKVSEEDFSERIVSQSS